MKRLRVFALTWLSYASYYFARKNFPVAKSAMQGELHLSTGGLAAIDTGYLATYAIGQFAGGWLGDRIGSRRLIGWGMLASAGLIAAFGASSSLLPFALLFALNGFVQATGWPGNIKAMAAWYGPEERGAVMGLWSTCFQAGPLVATVLAAFLLHRFGWRSAFIGPAIWVAIVGALVLSFLEEGPHDTRDAPRPQGEEVREARRKALANPIVWLLGGSYFGMKLIRYCIDFWLPFYLARSLGYPVDIAAYVSTAFQFGGIFGAVIIGYISDKMFPGRRGVVACVSTVLLALSLALYAQVAPLGLAVNFAAMAAVGFFLFGPDALISGVAAQDLGGPLAAASVAGFINGCGSIGAIAQGFLVARVSDAFGWTAVFDALVALAVLSALTLAVVGRMQARAAAAIVAS